jgi:magnesium transporter
MLIDCAHYKAGSRQREDPISIAEAGVLAAKRDGFVWLGIPEPTEQEMGEVATHFPVHELAIEDAREVHQRAKIEDYENHYFVVLRTARYDDDRERVDFGEIHIFAGPGYAITVRHGGASGLRPARERLEARPELMEAGPVAVVWAVLDQVVDDYGPVIEGLTADIEDTEERVFEGEVAELNGDVSWPLGRRPIGRRFGDQSTESKSYKDLLARGSAAARSRPAPASSLGPNRRPGPRPRAPDR